MTRGMGDWFDRHPVAELLAWLVVVGVLAGIALSRGGGP